MLCRPRKHGASMVHLHVQQAWTGCEQEALLLHAIETLCLQQYHRACKICAGGGRVDLAYLRHRVVAVTPKLPARGPRY